CLGNAAGVGAENPPNSTVQIPRATSPLRGFVLCDSCGKRMTAAWSTGCRQRYAYYRCATRGCQARGKSVRRASLEGSLEKILEAMQPSDDLAELAKAMISDAWDAKTAEAQRVKLEWARQLKDTEKQIDDLLDRAVDATNSSVRVAYEERVAKLDRRKFVLSEMVRLEGESLNSLFDTLQEWESHLAQHDLSDLRCDDDQFAP
ncbi:zinc ribbon domain-containing protein, partial [Sulfitobacter aestuarii]